MYQVAYIRRFAIYQVAYTCRLYSQVFWVYKNAYTRGFVDQKSRMRMHALPCTEKRIHVGKITFGPWRLVLGIWTYGFWTMASRQTCWSLVLSWWYWFGMVLDHGIEQSLRLYKEKKIIRQMLGESLEYLMKDEIQYAGYGLLDLS